jgi:hypothetical protein
MLDLKIPNPIKPIIEKEIKHIRKFEEFLSFAVPKIKKGLEIGGESSVFFFLLFQNEERISMMEHMFCN